VAAPGNRMISKESRFKETMDGSDQSPSAAMLRAAASCAEPVYSTVMRMRNALYDSGVLASSPLGRPTISVGNITTGGTGKTPVVQWLFKCLSASGEHPAILMRGYKTTSDGVSDEQSLFQAADILAIADPDRRRGAAAALARYPQTTLFILDDGMQHRRARRDFELVLVHAAEPFGFGRVFPRGLLREPLGGLLRAHAVLVTHADEVDPAAIAAITSTIRSHNKTAPIFQCDHVINGDFAGKKYFAFCGIGSPASFFRRLSTLGGTSVGTREFDDHHEYTKADLDQINEAAKSAHADLLITTGKDWVKLERFADQFALPIVRAELSLRFRPGDEDMLLTAIRGRLRV
jgi:tetraacyldisaccharide 4'-kinase